MSSSLKSRNRRLMFGSFAAAALMVGASFAAVPLYEIFCRVTGYGGTTQVADVAPENVLQRKMTVRFNADVDRGLPWRFEPVQGQVEVNVGEQRLAFYRARNSTDRVITGAATFNVTPLKAGQYFNKIACFCFTEQQLAAGQEVDMPVSFFIDPAIADDPNMDDVTTITLSYTFYQTETEPERADKNARAEIASPKNDG